MFNHLKILWNPQIHGHNWGADPRSTVCTVSEGVVPRGGPGCLGNSENRNQSEYKYIICVYVSVHIYIYYIYVEDMILYRKYIEDVISTIYLMISMYIYIYIHMYIYMCKFDRYSCMHACMHGWMVACMHEWMDGWSSWSRQEYQNDKNMSMFMDTFGNIRILSTPGWYIYIHIYIYIYIYTYIHRHNAL